MPRAFWQTVGIRAVKTFAQTLTAVLTAASIPLDILTVDWTGALSVSVGAALYSVLTSLSGLDAPTGRHADPTP